MSVATLKNKNAVRERFNSFKNAFVVYFKYNMYTKYFAKNNNNNKQSLKCI